MSSLWTIIGVSLIFQEFATTAAIFEKAIQSHFPFWPIHIIYIGATIFDMYVGFEAAEFLKKKAANTRFNAWADRAAKRLKKLLGKYGDAVSITVVAIFDYPYLNTFIASWLGIPRRSAFFFTFLGNFVWYVALWATVLGAKNIITSPTLLLLILAVIVGGASFLFKKFQRNL